jgi:hypothetical protein
VTLIAAAETCERQERLLALAYRCEWEEASRELDGAIHCAVHDVIDLNSLRNDGVLIGSIVTPLYTSRMEEARKLLGGAHPGAYPNDPLRTCAFALRALAKKCEP